MITRIAAAAVGLAVVLPALRWGGPLAVEVVVPLAMLIGLAEYSRMAFADDVWPSFGWLVALSSALYGAALYRPSALAVVQGASIMATLGWVTLRPRGSTLAQAAARAGYYLVGSTWMGLLGSLVLLRRLPQGLAWVLLVLAIAWLSDTGGYFAGRYAGRHKLYPRVSPNKTWEGFVGGLSLCALGSVAVQQGLLAPQLSVVDAVVLGIAGGCMGVLGDLAESLLKRSFGVKDSGGLLPGHGGLLDRIDSVLFVAPVVYAYTLAKGL